MDNNKILKKTLKLFVFIGILIYTVMQIYILYEIIYIMVDLWELDQNDIREMEAHEKWLKLEEKENRKFIGHYVFKEYITETDVVEYRINIYNDNYADVSIKGGGVSIYVEANPLFNTNSNELEILYYKDLKKDNDRNFENSATLLKFKKEDGKLLTTWGAIQPKLEKNSVSGEIYFRQLPFNTRVIDTYKLNNKDCSNNYSVYDEEVLKTNEDKDVFINIKYPQFTEINNIDVDNQLNEHIYQKAIEPFNKMMLEEQKLENINLDIDYEVTYCNQNILSIKFEGYIYDTYTGNGATRIYSTNIDLDTGEEIEFESLFNVPTYKIISPRIFKNDDIIQKDVDLDYIGTVFLDQIQKQNFEYFYYTSNEFYIVLPIKGDYEFSANYVTLDKYIDYDDELWQNFILK